MDKGVLLVALFTGRTVQELTAEFKEAGGEVRDFFSCLL